MIERTIVRCSTSTYVKPMHQNYGKFRDIDTSCTTLKFAINSLFRFALINLVLRFTNIAINFCNEHACLVEHGAA